jgi:F1F0 ATPase subunit 2
MNDALTLILACVTGAALGVIFFGGLWWTVRKGVSSNQPALWFIGSLLVRMTVVLLGFLLIGRGHWQRLLACLAGFIVARLFVTWKTRPLSLIQPRRTQGATHAP